MKILFHVLIASLVPHALALDSLPTFLRQEPNSWDERRLAVSNACPSNSTSNATIPLPRERTVRFGHQCTNIGCTANDLSYLNCTAVPADGDQCIECDCGEKVAIRLLCYVRATTNSGRSRAFIVADVLFGPTSCDLDGSAPCGVALCYDSPIGFMQGVDVPILFPTPIEWPCGSSITFQGTPESPIVLGAGSQSQTCSGITRCGDFSPKCDLVPQNIDITPPLSLDPLSQSCDLTQLDVEYAIRGGNPPFDIELTCDGVVVNTATVTARSGTISKPSDCFGFDIGVTVSSASNDGTEICTASVTEGGISCCVSTVSCNTLPAVPLEGCNSTAAYPNAMNPNQPPNGLFDESGVCDGDVITYTRTGNTINGGNLCTASGGLSVTRKWTASTGTECSVNLVITDTIPPVFTTCANSATTLTCSGANFPALTNCAWTDNCGTSGNPGPCCDFSGSGVTRTYTATDGCNSVSVVQTIGFPATGSSGSCTVP